MFELVDKTVLVTGGGSGIGEAIAIMFARRGARVYIIDVNEAAAAAVVAGVGREGDRAIFKACDITDLSRTAAVVDGIVEETGRIDILINNAGIAHIGTVESTDAQD